MRISSPRAEFAAGAKAEVPVLFGVLPFGLIYGALALQAGDPPVAAVAVASIVLARSAQFGLAQLLAAEPPRGLLLLLTLALEPLPIPDHAFLVPHLSRL